jgi:aspartate 4-decarboxylase
MRVKHITEIKTSRERQQLLQQLSPFELKDELILLAKENASVTSFAMLNAGRGNPNWIATTPREAFIALELFALEECKRNMFMQGFLAGVVFEKEGIAKRLETFLSENNEMAGVELLKKSYRYGIDRHKFDADAWVREMVEAIIGFNYPVPDRMLKHLEAVVHDFLVQEMCGGEIAEGKYDLFAVEGGTAAMCYIFDSLMNNFLLKKGDKVAMLKPIFTPYIEIAHLERYSFQAVDINANSLDAQGAHTWQFPDEEIDKLKDPEIKVAFVINPSNPPSYAISRETISRLKQIIKNDNPGLMIITDDVYGTFVDGFRSLMAEIPANTIGVYSFSKYFGATGWRLGTVAIHENNIYDKKIASLSDSQKLVLAQRYGTITLTPEKIKFIDRMVADSRQVALNHTAGLSTPQQMQMALFSLFAVLDKKNEYKKATQDLIKKRFDNLWKGLEIPAPVLPWRAAYYSEIDIMVGAKLFHGEEFANWLKENFEPTDILFRLAEKTSVVLLNGGGFGGPEWSIRISLANLPTETYTKIGKSIREIFEDYVKAWKAHEV